MNEQDYSFDEISNWVISLMRPKTNSKLSVHAPYDMATLLDLVSLDPNSEATEKAFDAIALWVAHNFPQWGIINIVPDYKVEQ
jgi:hypothetical protein